MCMHTHNAQKDTHAHTHTYSFEWVSNIQVLMYLICKSSFFFFLLLWVKVEHSTCGPWCSETISDCIGCGNKPNVQDAARWRQWVRNTRAAVTGNHCPILTVQNLCAIKVLEYDTKRYTQMFKVGRFVEWCRKGSSLGASSCMVHLGNTPEKENVIVVTRFVLTPLPHLENFRTVLSIN